MERAAVVAAVADFASQRFGKSQVRKARRHHVGHHVGLGHGLENLVRGMAKTKHAVAAGIVQYRTLGGDDPGPASGQCDVRVDRIVGIEIDVGRLQCVLLLSLVSLDQIRIGHLPTLDHTQRIVHGLSQALVQFGKANNGVVRQPGCQRFTANLAQSVQFVEDRHGGAPERFSFSRLLYQAKRQAQGSRRKVQGRKS